MSMVVEQRGLESAPPGLDPRRRRGFGPAGLLVVAASLVIGTRSLSLAEVWQGWTLQSPSADRPGTASRFSERPPS
ncbi:hypothetical protein [Lentzea sp. NPDC055074]